MTVHVERDVALVVARDALAAVEHLDEVGEEPDEGCEDYLRNHLEHDGPLDLEDLGDEGEPPMGYLLWFVEENHAPGTPESVMRPVQGASHSTVHPTGRARWGSRRERGVVRSA